MREPCKNFKDYFQHIIGQFAFFLMRILGETFTALMFVALIFSAISLISPGWYRWASQWANHPLLPIAKTCNVTEVTMTTKERVSGTKKYKILISFDTVLKSKQRVLVFDNSGEGIQILNSKGNDDHPRTFQFIKGSGDKEINFYVLSRDDILKEGKIDYADCPFNIQFIED